jgi:hypothetical protein
MYPGKFGICLRHFHWNENALGTNIGIAIDIGDGCSA